MRFPFIYHHILLALREEVSVLLDDLQEQIEFLITVFTFPACNIECLLGPKSLVVGAVPHS